MSTESALSPEAVRAAPSRLQPDIPPRSFRLPVFTTTAAAGRVISSSFNVNPEEDFVMSIVPPASATLIWAFPTEFEEIRCYVWEHSPAGWSIAVMFGNETLALEVAPTRWAMETGVDMVWRGLLSSGIGKFARDRFEDPFCPHAPFRHREPALDADSEPFAPTRRRRLH
jgi:hypothetical protein